MIGTIEDFYQELHLEVAAESEAYGGLSEDAFFAVGSRYLIDSCDILQSERVVYNHTGLRVDGYTGDPSEEDGILTIIVVNYCNGSGIEPFRRADLDTLCKRAINFISKCTSKKFVDSLEETLPVSQLAELIYARWNQVRAARIIILTNRLLKIRSNTLPVLPVNGVDCSISLWDLSRLYQYSSSGKSREDIFVDLANDFGGSLAALSAHLSDTDYKSYLLVMPGVQLANIYAKWGTQLLEKNVRVFLQARGKVNKGIRETIDNDPSMLFAYNNGITATAEAVETEPTRYGLAMTSITNLQIVNGGQTTASIYDAWRRKVDLSKVFVQMKLSVVDPVKSEEIVLRISEYANTQNKVSAADFFSNHPFQISIEKYSRQVTAPRKDGSLVDSKWFYERARGQYSDERAKANGNSAKKKFDIIYPRSQLITKTDLAKYLNTWNRKPDIVSRGAQRNFADFAESVGTQWRKDPEVFNELFFKRSVAKAILFRRLERIVSDQEWYKGGYRANVVIYTLALMSNIFHSKGKTFDLARIWLKQEIHGDLESELARVAHDVYKHLVSPPDGSPTNVTEYAKTSKCWTLLLERPIVWTKAIDVYSVPKSVQRIEAKQAADDMKIRSGLEALKDVLSRGSAFWSSLSRWATDQPLSATEKSLLVKASSKAFYPTEKQAFFLLAILKRCQDNGYK